MKTGKRISKVIVSVCGIGLALVVGVAFVILFLNREESDTKSSMQEWFCDASFSGALYGNDGMFKYGENGITFVDISTKKETPICQKIGCQHKDKECDGWIEGLNQTLVSYNGEYLFYLGNMDTKKDFKSVDLVRCNTDGTNRKVLHTFQNMQTVTAVCCQNERLYVAYCNGYDLKAKEEKIDVEAGICVYDFRKDTEEMLYHSTSVGNKILSLDVRDDIVCFSHNFCDLDAKEIIEKKDDAKQDHTFLYLEYLKGKEKRILSKSLSSGISGVAMGKDVIIFSDDKGMEKYNVKTRHTQSIYKGSQTRLVKAIGFDDDAFYAVFDDKTGKENYYRVEKFKESKKTGTSSDAIFWMFKDTVYGMNKNGKWIYRKNNLAKITGS